MLGGWEKATISGRAEGWMIWSFLRRAVGGSGRLGFGRLLC